MKIFRFHDLHNEYYARMGRRGTWDGMNRVRPLIIEWQKGSDRIGDFSWPGFDSDIVVTDRVGQALLNAGFKGFELSPVEMIEDRRLKGRKTRKPLVRLPYAGPPLWDLFVTAWVNRDEERTTYRTEINAQTGKQSSRLDGIEEIISEFDPNTKYYKKKRIPRVLGKGLFISEQELSDYSIFRVVQSGAIFCTDQVKQFIEDQGFTNVSFMEIGETF